MLCFVWIRCSHGDGCASLLKRSKPTLSSSLFKFWHESTLTADSHRSNSPVFLSSATPECPGRGGLYCWQHTASTRTHIFIALQAQQRSHLILTEKCLMLSTAWYSGPALSGTSASFGLFLPHEKSIVPGFPSLPDKSRHYRILAGCACQV